MNQQIPAIIPCRNTSGRGYTLIELVVVVGILGILMAIAIPNLFEFVSATRVRMQAEEIVSDLALARSEASTRALRTVVCVSTDGAACVAAATDWQRGRLIFVDRNSDGAVSGGEVILKYQQALSGDTTITRAGFASATSLTFGPYGGLVPATSGTLTLCSAGSPNGNRIAIAATGRVTRTRIACP